MSTDHSVNHTADRGAALALVAGSLAGLVTMALHPTGRDAVRNASAGDHNTLLTAVHALGLLAQPVVLAGVLALTRRLRARREVAVGAYAFFALASVAVVVAAVASGFIAPGVLRGYAEADEPARAAMQSALHYTGLVNQAFARVYVLFSGVAVLLWSWAMLPERALPRPLAAYGLVLGGALILGASTGHLRLDVHGFGLVVLGEGAWMVCVAAQLWRGPAAETPP